MANELKFGKGIGVAAGFDLGAQKPLDSRYTVATIEERDAHVTGNRAYDGMLVFVEADKKTYQYLDGAWVEFGFNNDKLQAEVVDNLESDDSAKILSAKQGKVLKGLIDAEAEAARAAEKANADAIDAIEADYLKAADMAAEVEARNAAIKVTDDKVVALAETHATDKQALENAIALKADKTAFEQAVEVLEGEDERIEGLITAETGRAAGEEARIEGLVTAEAGRAAGEEARIEGLVTAEATKAREEEGKLANRIKAVEDDYLKEADKIELQDNISSLTGVVEALRDGVDATKVDGILDLIKYVEDHGPEVTGMKEDIAENAQAIADHATEYAEHLTAQAAIDEAQDAKIKALEDRFTGEGSVEDMIADAKDEAIEEAGKLADAAKSAAITAAATDATNKANAAQQAAETKAAELADAAQEAAEATAAADATAKANAAEEAAKAHAEQKASAAQTAAEAKAKELADAATDLANAAQTAADKAQEEVDALEGRVDTAEGEIDTLQSEMDAVEAKAAANEEAIAKLNGASNVEGSVANLIATAKAEAATDAQTKANAAEKNAKDYTDEKFNAVVETNNNQETEINNLKTAVGDGKVDDRIATAKQGAIDAAAADATAKADAAQAAAEATAKKYVDDMQIADKYATKDELDQAKEDLTAEIDKKANDADLHPIAKSGSFDNLEMGLMTIVFDCGGATEAAAAVTYSMKATTPIVSSGSDGVFESDGKTKDLTKVEINGEVVDPSLYTVSN